MITKQQNIELKNIELKNITHPDSAKELIVVELKQKKKGYNHVMELPKQYATQLLNNPLYSDAINFSEGIPCEVCSHAEIYFGQAIFGSQKGSCVPIYLNEHLVAVMKFHHKEYEPTENTLLGLETVIDNQGFLKLIRGGIYAPGTQLFNDASETYRTGELWAGLRTTEMKISPKRMIEHIEGMREIPHGIKSIREEIEANVKF